MAGRCLTRIPAYPHTRIPAYPHTRIHEGFGILVEGAHVFVSGHAAAFFVARTANIFYA